MEGTITPKKIISLKPQAPTSGIAAQMFNVRDVSTKVLNSRKTTNDGVENFIQTHIDKNSLTELIDQGKAPQVKQNLMRLNIQSGKRAISTQSCVLRRNIQSINQA